MPERTFALDPAPDHIICELVDDHLKQAGGIVLPDGTARDAGQQLATVIAVGSAVKMLGENKTIMAIDIGDTIIFTRCLPVALDMGLPPLMIVPCEKVVAKVRRIRGEQLAAPAFVTG